MELAIQRLDGTIYNLADYGIKTLDYQVDEASPRVLSEIAEGQDGNIELETTYDARQIRASFFMTSVDGADFVLLRNEIFRVFSNREQFYLIDTRENAKRWLVRSNGFALGQIRATKGRFDVEFTASKPFAESVGTTLDPLTFDAELWQIGQGLTVDPTEYEFTTSAFSVYNAGDVAVDPRTVPVAITFTGASNNLTITNATTGDVWQYTGTTAAADTVKLDGIRSLKNGASIFGQTNRKIITIAKGWNDFTVTGATAPFSISFDFRFYYL